MAEKPSELKTQWLRLSHGMLGANCNFAHQFVVIPTCVLQETMEVQGSVQLHTPGSEILKALDTFGDLKGTGHF